jgi:hypothetical protein
MQSHVGQPFASEREPLGQARKHAIAGQTTGGHFVIVHPHVPADVGPHTGPATEPSLQIIEGTPGAGPHSFGPQVGAGLHWQVGQPFASVA